MPHQKQNDWPSFETVLRDVAPDSLTVRSRAMANRRAEYAEKAAKIRETNEAAQQTPEKDLEVISTPESPELETPEDELAVSLLDAELPDPLPPLELDTSRIRALLDPDNPAPLDAAALEALKPLPVFDIQLTPSRPDTDGSNAEQDDAEHTSAELDAVDHDRVDHDRADHHEVDVREIPSVSDDADVLDISDEADFDLVEGDVAPDVLDLFVDDVDYDDVAANLDVEPLDLGEGYTDVDVETDLDVDTDVDVDVDAEADAELEADVEVETERNSDVPTYDPSTDGVQFGSSTPWGDTADFATAEASDVAPSVFDTPTFDSPAFEAPTFDEPVFETQAFEHHEFETPTLFDTPTFETPSLFDAPAYEDTTPDAPELDLTAELTVDPIDEPTLAATETDLWDLNSDDTPDQIEDLDTTTDNDTFDVGQFEAHEPLDEIELESAGIEIPNTSSATEIFEDLAPNIGTIDLGDLADDEHSSLDPEEIEKRKADLFDFSGEAGTIELPDTTPDFDSIATAEEIENHLDSLVSFDDEDAQATLDNVIPLRPGLDVATVDGTFPETFDNTDSFDDMGTVQSIDFGGETADANDLFDDVSATDEAFEENDDPRPNETGWVSLPPEVESKPGDPWAYMRPVEPPKKKGFWANRPKFFGGEARRRARAAKENPEIHEMFEIDALGITYDKTCPNCSNEQCNVDLDDPIGRRVHASCPSCGHLWHTPYVFESEAAS